MEDKSHFWWILRGVSCPAPTENLRPLDSQVEFSSRIETILCLLFSQLERWPQIRSDSCLLCKFWHTSLSASWDSNISFPQPLHCLLKLNSRTNSHRGRYKDTSISLLCGNALRQQPYSIRSSTKLAESRQLRKDFSNSYISSVKHPLHYYFGSIHWILLSYKPP